jgi:hypothetical protein
LPMPTTSRAAAFMWGPLGCVTAAEYRVIALRHKRAAAVARRRATR